MAPSGQLDQHRVGGLETAVTMVELDMSGIYAAQLGGSNEPTSLRVYIPRLVLYPWLPEHHPLALETSSDRMDQL